MERKIKILHLEDLHSDAVLIEKILKEGTFEFETLVVDAIEPFTKALKEFSPDIILSDHSLGSFNSGKALEIIQGAGLKIPFILITGNTSEESAIDVIKKGADDYILKDRLQRLPTAIQNSLEKFRLQETSDKDMLHQQAFDNSLQANIIFVVSTGKIVIANKAAAKLLGYSKKELLTKNRATIFDINESSFKEMMKERTAEGHSIALVTVMKKSGKKIPCEITSAVFIDELGIEKSITTIRDRSSGILKQKNIDIEKEKIVAADIAHAKSKQIDIDFKKEKLIADNIIAAQKKSDVRLEENNEWIKYIAKTSYDVMWDWDIISGEIYVGDSIEEVFGYKVQNNMAGFNDFTGLLLPGEKEKVEKKLTRTLSSRNKTWNDSFVIKRKDGSDASTTCRAYIVRDEAGKAIRLIGAIQDVSRVQELEKKMEMQSSTQPEHKFLLASKLSFDVIWDWNLLTNDVFIGEGFQELFGYTIMNNKGAKGDWGNHLHPDDKETVEAGLHKAIDSSATHWEQAYRFIRADGSIAKIFDRASIIRHSNGQAYRMIGAMQDLGWHKSMEERLDHQMAIKDKLLEEYKQSFKLMFNSSSDILFDSDLVTGEVIISKGYKTELGYKITNHMTPEKNWIPHIHPEDKEAVVQDYLRMLDSDEVEWKYDYRYLKADHSIANVTSNTIVLRNASGKAYRIIGSMQDISKEKVLEERLAQEIKLKEKQITEATEDAKGAERSDIGKELHDNINQLLGASRMYLQMARNGGVNSQSYLSRSSEYTMNAIEEIRKLTKGLTNDTIKNLGLSIAIENMIHDTREMNPVKITCDLDSFLEKSVDDKFKLNVFRIVQEQLNNILKHAKATKVSISLLQDKKSIKLSVSDNGVGFDTAKKQTGIGIENIKSRAATYKATADFISQPGKGCVLNVIFPFADAQLIKN